MRFEATVDIDWYDVIYEMSEKEKKLIYDEIKDEFDEDKDVDKIFHIRTVEDEFKIEILKELFEKKSLKELQDIVNNK